MATHSKQIIELLSHRGCERLLELVCSIATILFFYPLFGAGKQIAAGEITGKSDDPLYNSARRRIYVLTIEGYLEGFEQKNPGQYDRVARHPTPSGTQLAFLFGSGGKLFVAVRAQSGKSLNLASIKRIELSRLVNERDNRATSRMKETQ
jgi:hypothetical protein